MTAILCFGTLGSTAPDDLAELVRDWNLPPDAGCTGYGGCPAYCQTCG